MDGGLGSAWVERIIPSQRILLGKTQVKVKHPKDLLQKPRAKGPENLTQRLGSTDPLSTPALCQVGLAAPFTLTLR